MEATNWLDETVQQAKEKYHAQRALEEELIQEEMMKRKLGNQFCRELFAWLETVDMKFNARFGSQVLTTSVVGSEGNRTVQVLARPIRAEEKLAELNYQEDISCLTLSSGAGATTTTQVIRLIRSTDDEILAEIGAERYTPEKLGQKIITDLLGVGFGSTVSPSRSSERAFGSVSGNNIGTHSRAPVATGGNGTYANALS